MKSASVLRITLGAQNQTLSQIAIESSHGGEASSAPRMARASPRAPPRAATRTKTEAPGQGRDPNDRGARRRRAQGARVGRRGRGRRGGGGSAGRRDGRRARRDGADGGGGAVEVCGGPALRVFGVLAVLRARKGTSGPRRARRAAAVELQQLRGHGRPGGASIKSGFNRHRRAINSGARAGASKAGAAAAKAGHGRTAAQEEEARPRHFPEEGDAARAISAF